MGATNIQDAKSQSLAWSLWQWCSPVLVLIQSSRVNDRTAGLKDLIHILKHNRGKPSLEALSNKSYLALCEALFQCLQDERSSFLLNKVKSSKSKTAALLPLSASALRHVVATGVRTIKGSTVEIIIDTIIEVLPGKDRALITPLLEDLPKALRSLLEYQPHVERLSKDCWNATIDFCIESLSGFFGEPDSEPENSWSTNISSRGRTPFESTDVTFSRASPRDPIARNKSVPDEFSYAAEDFIHCLHSLVKASNAPVLDKAEIILAALLQFLQRRTGRGSITASALATINLILARVTFQSLALTKRFVRELLPLMKSMWSEIQLRDEILITLMYTEAHISSLLNDPQESTVRFSLEALVETIYGDYRRRQDTTAHQYLEEDHLCFRCFEEVDKDTHPFNTAAFSMETEHFRDEGLWATVSTIARYSFKLDQRKRMFNHDREDGEESFIKRPRVTQLFHEYLRHVLEPRSNAKRAALQVVAFMVQEGRLDEEDLQTMLEKLISCISDENSVHSVWAMVGLTA